jgi:hypothetical protein
MQHCSPRVAMSHVPRPSYVLQCNMGVVVLRFCFLFVSMHLMALTIRICFSSLLQSLGSFCVILVVYSKQTTVIL